MATAYTALSITAWTGQGKCNNVTTGWDLWRTATGPVNNTENSSLKDGVFLRVPHIVLSHCYIEPVQRSLKEATIAWEIMTMGRLLYSYHKPANSPFITHTRLATSLTWQKTSTIYPRGGGMGVWEWPLNLIVFPYTDTQPYRWFGM